VEVLQARLVNLPHLAVQKVPVYHHQLQHQPLQVQANRHRDRLLAVLAVQLLAQRQAQPHYHHRLVEAYLKALQEAHLVQHLDQPVYLHQPHFRHQRHYLKAPALVLHHLLQVM